MILQFWGLFLKLKDPLICRHKSCIHTYIHTYIYIYIYIYIYTCIPIHVSVYVYTHRSVYGVMVIIIKNAEIDTVNQVQNPRWGSLHFPWHYYPRANESNYFPSSYRKIVRQTGLFNLGMASDLGAGNFWIQTC